MRTEDGTVHLRVEAGDKVFEKVFDLKDLPGGLEGLREKLPRWLKEQGLDAWKLEGLPEGFAFEIPGHGRARMGFGRGGSDRPLGFAGPEFAERMRAWAEQMRGRARGWREGMRERREGCPGCDGRCQEEEEEEAWLWEEDEEEARPGRRFEGSRPGSALDRLRAEKEELERELAELRRLLERLVGDGERRRR